MFFTVLDSAVSTVVQPGGIYLVVGTLSAFVAVHLLFTRFFSSSNTTFKRDVHNKTFNTVSGATGLLSNPDSVLSREKVQGSIAEYETLFAGARKSVGTTSNRDSIEHREKEYQTMVNSFYDLVTDFYEWGWGQVSYCCSLLVCHIIF
jgi:hypothetical protein